MSVQTRIRLTLIADETRDVGSLGGAAKLSHEVARSITLASGDAAGQTAFAYSADPVTVSPSGVAFDLVGTALQSLIDNATDIDLDEIVCVFVENTGGSVDLLVGGGTNPVISNQIAVPPGGFVLLYLGQSGRAVADGATDALNLIVGSGSTTARLWLVGR